MMHQLVSRRLPAAVLAALLALAAVALFLSASGGGSTATATHTPADKVVASGSTVEVGEPGQELTLLSGTLRSSAPSDLLISVTAECAIATDLTTEGNDTAEATGVAEVWVEVDGTAIGVNNVGTSTTTAEPQDDGKAVFCQRAYRRETSMFDDQDATIKTFLRTREASGFNWVALNVGKGIHTVEVLAELTETTVNEATADVAIGDRTVIVEPAKLANDASV